MDSGYISPSDIKHIIDNDPFVSILKKGNHPSDCKNNPLFNSGEQFEKKIINSITQLANTLGYKFEKGGDLTDQGINFTKKLIYNKCPIIIQPSLRCMNIHGFADIIIRADVFQELFSKGNGNIDSYHVIEIKSRKLNTDSKSKIKDDSKNRFAKCQSIIYKNAVNYITKQKDNSFFLLGKSDTDNICGGLFELEDDKSYDDIIFNAISTYLNLPNNIDYIEYNFKLWPNMKNDSIVYEDTKKKFALKVGEISLVSGINSNQRKILHNQNIFTIQDPKCNSENAGIKSKDKAKIFDGICNINRKSNKNLFSIDENPFIKNLPNNLIWLDIEHANDIIYLIGIVSNAGYKSFVASTLDKNGEYEMLINFRIFFDELGETPIMFYSADESKINKAFKKHNITEISKEKWYDLHKILQKDNIFIKDCYNYSIKDIGNAMLKHKMIKSIIPTDCKSGFESIGFAIHAYSQDNPLEHLKSIIEYNKYDCTVLYEIYTFFKNC